MVKWKNFHSSLLLSIEQAQKHKKLQHNYLTIELLK